MTSNCDHIIKWISFHKAKLSSKEDAIPRNHKLQREAKLLIHGKMYFTILRYNGNITWIQRLHGSLRFLKKILRTMIPYWNLVFLNLLMHNIVYSLRGYVLQVVLGLGAIKVYLSWVVISKLNHTWVWSTSSQWVKVKQYEKNFKHKWMSN